MSLRLDDRQRRRLDELKTINAERNSELGIGMTVATPGFLSTRDAVQSS